MASFFIYKVCPNFFYFFPFLIIYIQYILSLYHNMGVHLIDLIFPRQCIHCWVIWAYLCTSCKKRLQPHPEICPYCHRFSKDYRTCIECKTNKNNYLEGIIIPFVYTDLLKTLIIKLKYFHKKDIWNFLIERLDIALQANQSLQYELAYYHHPKKKFRISFIPSHRYRNYFIKWYNQSKILAKKLSIYKNIPMISVAQKNKHTKTQASLDRKGRIINLKNTFSLTQKLNFTGEEIVLIIDDITTTGSTINEVAKCIKQKYPNIKIRWMVVGRHI